VKVNLTKQELDQIRDYIEKSNAANGERYPAWATGLAYADTPELGKQCVLSVWLVY
jgi:hypothetical protein